MANTIFAPRRRFATAGLLLTKLAKTNEKNKAESLKKQHNIFARFLVITNYLYYFCIMIPAQNPPLAGVGFS